MMRTASGTLSRLLLLASLALALAACPQTAPPVHGDSAPAAQHAAPAPAPPASHKPAPQMGGPLPAQVAPQPVKLDYSCRADSDCAVKNVGSCCGAYTACVNKDSPADPAAVRAQCAKEGRGSSCSIRNITHCGCQQGRCEVQGKAPVGGWPDDPPLQPDPVR